MRLLKYGRWLRALAVVFSALLFPAFASAQNTLRWTTNYYAVTGTNLSEVRQSLRQSHPWKDSSDLDGSTSWRIEWRFDLAPSADGCRCNSFTTQTTIATTLPRWIAPTNAALPVKETWDRYVNALGRHEAGHAQIGLSAVAELHQRMKNVGPEADCDGLKKSINNLAERIVDKHRQQDKDYDQRTEHGAKEGAFLPGLGRGPRPWN